MQKKQVALIDVGSSKMTAIIGERGINKTFIIKAKKEFFYDGFSERSFFDVEDTKKTIISAAKFLILSSSKNIEELYIGVPGEFTNVIVKDSQISFPKKKKITDIEIDALYDAAFVMSSAKYTLINRSAITYEIDDSRRLSDPIGISSMVFKGKLSFVLCDNYFIEAIKPSLNAVGFSNIEFVSIPLAQAMYLLQAEERDRIAMIADIGYISSTFSIVQGDGIIYQKSFSFGGGYVTANISEKFLIDFDTAESLKRKVNLCQESGGEYDLVSGDNGEYYSSETLRTLINNSLDTVCEEISNAMYDSGYVIPEYVPLFITGGGIAFIRGAKEKISNRLGVTVNILSPKVPLMDKPTESSVLSVLDLVFND